MINDTNSWIVDKIKHCLQLYPGINLSMLQLSITLPAAQWKPVFQILLDTGTIRQELIVAESPGKRIQNYLKLFWVEK